MEMILDLLAEDNELIPYRKSLRRIAGSVTATILLQQMIFYDRKMGGAFYKFKSPCEHELYKQGDSWTEKLGFSKKEFDTALKRIGTKITRGASKKEARNKTDSTGLVIYWTDANRVTWYHLNRDLLGKLLKGIYLVEEQRELTHEIPNGDLHDSENKNTTEILGPNGTKPKTLDPHEQDLLRDFGIFGHNGNPPEPESLEEEVKNSGWPIKSNLVEQALIAFLKAGRESGLNLPIPNSDTRRKDWLRSLSDHIKDFGIDGLEDRYKKTIQKAKDGNWFEQISRPGSLDKTLPTIGNIASNGKAIQNEDGSYYL